MCQTKNDSFCVFIKILVSYEEIRDQNSVMLFGGCFLKGQWDFVKAC